MRQISVKVKPKESRLDKYLSKVSKNLSRSQVKKLIKDGFVLVNDHKADPDYGIKRNDRIKLEIPPPKPTAVLPENIPLKIIFEDESIAVLEKPAGMVVHPTLDHPSGTLVNALLFHFKGASLPATGKTVRPGIVHRLDKGTSGLMIIAKTQESLRELKRQFKNREVVKKYLLLVSGKIKPPSGLIEKTIGRHPKNRRKFTISGTGRDAVTWYNVKEYIRDSFSLVEAEPKTGRTHQIRVHFSSIGYPIFGDKLYGGEVAPRIFLHASYLEFAHPKTGEKANFTSGLPTKLEDILKKVRVNKKK
jgi:23S rRNA pseudouridine1911/1915/1917 synthase